MSAWGRPPALVEDRSMTPRAFASLTVAILIAACPVLPATGAAQTAPLPSRMLWAWERPCDLAGIDPRDTGVAFLALTLRLDADGLSPIPRRQPLRYPPGAALVAVARVETDARRPPRLAPGLAEDAATAIAGIAGGGGIAGVQVDFDASSSERAFYRDLLAALRRRLPAGMPLSMTALASWCLGDPWLEGLPVDEAVPMLFRMGPDADDVRHRLAAGDDFAEPLCRVSVGVADDEPAPPVPRGRRRWLFLAGGCGPGAATIGLSSREEAR